MIIDHIFRFPVAVFFDTRRYQMRKSAFVIMPYLMDTEIDLNVILQFPGYCLKRRMEVVAGNPIGRCRSLSAVRPHYRSEIQLILKL